MIAREIRPAAGYIRMSTDMQDKSVASQRSEIETYAKRNSFKIVRWYIDEGMSGDDRSREQFNQLVKDAGTLRDFDVILCWHQDRFSRFNHLKFSHYCYLLSEADVELWSVCQNQIDFNTIQGFLIASITQNTSNEFLPTHANNVIRGKRDAIKAGRWQSRAPFGYDRVDGKLHPNANAPLAKWMFQEFSKRDVSLRWLAGQMNLKGVKTTRGKLWGASGVRAVLENPAYTGLLRWGRLSRAKHVRFGSNGDIKLRERDRARIIRPESELLIKEDAHPSIISKALFESVQRRLAERDKRPRKSRLDSAPLTGIVKCGHCGAGMCKTGVPPWLAYRCNSNERWAEKRPECGTCINRKIIHEQVVKHLYDSFLSDERITEYHDRVVKYLTEQRASHSARSSSLKAQQAEIAGKIAKAETRLLELPPDMLDAVCRQIRELRCQADALAQELLAGQRIHSLSESAVAQDATRVVKFLQAIRSDLSSEDAATMRAAVSRLVERIEIFSKPTTKRGGKMREFSHLLIVYRPDLALAEDAADASIKNGQYQEKYRRLSIEGLLRAAGESE